MEVLSKTDVTQTALDFGSENCLSNINPPSPNSTNVYLVQAINDLKAKFVDI